jgi:hypothetical protein
VVISADNLKAKSTLFVVEEIYGAGEYELAFDTKKVDFLAHA